MIATSMRKIHKFNGRLIILGLSWLWRTWQETAPGYQAPRQQRPVIPAFSQPQQQQTSSSNDELSFDEDVDSSGTGLASNSVCLC